MTRFLVQLDERHPSDDRPKSPIWFNKHHAWTNRIDYATPLTLKQAEVIARAQRAKPFPNRTIAIVEAHQ